MELWRCNSGWTATTVCMAEEVIRGSILMRMILADTNLHSRVIREYVVGLKRQLMELLSNYLPVADLYGSFRLDFHIEHEDDDVAPGRLKLDNNI